jgi:hypothetical protein
MEMALATALRSPFNTLEASSLTKSEPRLLVGSGMYFNVQKRNPEGIMEK